MNEDLDIVRHGLRETIAYQCGRGPRPASAQSAVETAGPVSSLGVDGGSLPVSSAEALIARWRELENKHRMCAGVHSRPSIIESQNRLADVYKDCADDLRWELERTTRRQPEENTKISLAQPDA